DPIRVGQNLTYTIRVNNTGSLAATKVEVSAELPPQLKAVKASGPVSGKIDGLKVTFPAVDSIKPGSTTIFTIDAQAISDGDGKFQASVGSLTLSSPIRSE